MFFYRILFILTLLICLQSCISYEFTVLGNNPIPKKAKAWYVTNPKDIYLQNLVDTNAIYYYTIVGSFGQHPPKQDTLYFYYRFFSDGKVFIKSPGLFEKPTNEDANNITNGLTGYYLIKDGELIVKSFGTAYGGSYDIEIAKVFEDKIIIYKERTTTSNNGNYYPKGSLSHFQKTNQVLYKLDVGELHSKPDW